MAADFLSWTKFCRLIQSLVKLLRGGALVLRGAGRRVRDTLYRTGLWRVLELQTRSGRPLV